MMLRYAKDWETGKLRRGLRMYPGNLDGTGFTI